MMNTKILNYLLIIYKNNLHVCDEYFIILIKIDYFFN